MLLYLVRHGETALNAQGVYQGHLQTPLNAKGRKQAEQLSRHLRAIPFKQCWSSPLPRAAETAKIVLGPHHSRSSIQLDPLLTDRAMGQLEGKPWVADPALEGAAMGVESDEALTVRVHTFLSNLVREHTPLSSPLASPLLPSPLSDSSGQGSGCVLVVTHEACLLALLQILTDSSAGEYFPDAHTAHQQDVSTKIELEGGGAGGKPKLTVQTSFDTPRPDSARSPSLPCIVDTHIPPDVDVGQQCANTALCVVRVWWEEAVRGDGGDFRDPGLVAKGRVESWGDINHLVD